MEQFYTQIQPIFERIQQPIPDFEYNKKTNEYVAIDGYTLDDIDYTVIVKGNGQVVYGLVEGDKFYEEETLGYI